MKHPFPYSEADRLLNDTRRAVAQATWWVSDGNTNHATLSNDRELLRAAADLCARLAAEMYARADREAVAAYQEVVRAYRGTAAPPTPPTAPPSPGTT